MVIILYLEKIMIESPEEHRKTYDGFKKLVNIGILDVELLRIYEKVLIRADTLLEIFRIEKKLFHLSKDSTSKQGSC